MSLPLIFSGVMPANLLPFKAQVINEQLTHALNSRVVIEQAKGKVAERLGVDMEASFTALRNHARNHNLRLVDVAEAVIGGTLAASELGGGGRRS